MSIIHSVINASSYLVRLLRLPTRILKPCSKNTLPDLTSRLAPTHRYETEHFRFFGTTALDLWECGGQRNFTEYYLSESGQATVFAQVSAMIFTFEVTKLDTNGQPPDISMQYFSKCIEALHRHSPSAPIIVLIQKMDLVQQHRRRDDFDSWVAAAKGSAGDTPFTAFGTSIHEASLYRAWSAMIQLIVPNIDDLTKSLNIFTQSCGAIETVIFEKTTFLLVARSSINEIPRSEILMATHNISGTDEQGASEEVEDDPLERKGNRFELIIKLVKGLQISTRAIAKESFEALRMDVADFTLVLDVLTSTSYILVLASNKEPRISMFFPLDFWSLLMLFFAAPEAISLNIDLVRSRFELLQATGK